MIRDLLLDGRPLQSRSAVRGIGTYARGLLDGMHTLGADRRIGLVLAGSGAPARDLERWDVATVARVPTVQRRLQPLLDPLLMSWVVARRRPALYHALEWAQPIISRTPVVITIYDLIPFLFGRDYRWMRRERSLALRQVRHADAVIAISESTARDLVEHAGVGRDRITVTPLAPMHGLTPPPHATVATTLERLGVRQPYVLGAGSFDPHKRLPLLLDVAARVRRTHGNLQVVITGDQGPYLPRVRSEIHSAGVGAATHLLGHVPREDLAALYAGATCLLFTSAYEGFGIPVLEAMRCGAPVLCFDNSSLPEVAGDAGLLVRDGDTAAMAAALQRLLDHAGARDRHVAAGLAWSAGFTWERTARATLEVYERLLAR